MLLEYFLNSLAMHNNNETSTQLDLDNPRPPLL